jgi:hypothetical protein
LKTIELSIPDDVVREDLRLFVQEQEKTDRAKEEHQRVSVWNPARWWYAHLSFYDCFRWVFASFACLGCLIILAGVFVLGQNARPPAGPTQQHFYIGNQPATPTQGKP